MPGVTRSRSISAAWIPVLDNWGECGCQLAPERSSGWQRPLLHKLPTMHKRTKLGADTGMRVVQLKNCLHVKFKIGLYKTDHTCSVTLIHLSRHHSRSMVPAAFYIRKALAVLCLCKLKCHILSKSSCHTTVGRHLTHLWMRRKPSATTGPPVLQGQESFPDSWGVDFQIMAG